MKSSNLRRRHQLGLVLVHATLAGGTEADLEDRSSVTWVEPPSDLNFPTVHTLVQRIVTFMIR